MADYEAPPAPRHLNATGARFWAEVCVDYELTEHDDLELLRLAAEALDRARQASRILRDEGLQIRDRFGVPHAHPMLSVEARSRSAAVAIVKQIQQLHLALDRQEAIERRHRERLERPRPARRGGGRVGQA
jgi:phage terminase small subunit